MSLLQDKRIEASLLSFSCPDLHLHFLDLIRVNLEGGKQDVVFEILILDTVLLANLVFDVQQVH